ncbi:MAG: glycosyltransferase [Nitrososphaeria archaeon]|nr:glycosyltransferase family 2 protein [Conexivisphaerales archaeon]
MSSQPKVSIVIPVFRNSANLKYILKALFNDSYKEKEVIVTVDEPDGDFFNTELIDRCLLIVNNRRIGKVESLNRAYKMAQGDYIIFLDADVMIPDDLISRSVKTATESGADILDYVKLGYGKKLLERMASMDYAISSAFLELGSKFLKKTIALDGAAFMIKKDSLLKIGGFRHFYAEDLDLGLKSYINGLKYVMSDIKVFVKQPENAKKWFDQRIRWSYGLSEWLLNNFFRLIFYVMEAPWFFVSFLVFVISPLTSLGLFYLVSAPFINNFMMLYLFNPLINMTPLFSKFPRIYFFYFTRFFTIFAGSFVVTILVYLLILKHYRLKFTYYDLLIYYFIYQPLLLVTYMLGFTIYVLRIKVEFNWKV